MLVAVVALAIAITIVLAWRHTWAPAVGALIGVVIAVAGGVAELGDVSQAAGDLWRPLIVIVGIMTTTACAAELGVFAWMATWIEPRTRGPVRHGFRMVFVTSALTAALLSNDAAILLVTPVVVELIKQVYPKRSAQLVVPFAFAAFVGAGVAPLPTGNPMNLVVASRAHIDVNTYAVHMVPVAIVGWIVAYFALAFVFRRVLADEAPAPGEASPRVPLSSAARVVVAIAGCSIASYPVMAGFGAPLWPVAAIAALACTIVTVRAGAGLYQIGGNVSWELLPFLFGTLVLATALARVGLTGELDKFYEASPAPLATIGGVAAVGSAVINNHPMALLHSHALAGAPTSHVLAALVGGDLGPRLLPIGSLAGLLWTHALRHQGVEVPLKKFVGVGIVVTIPSLAVSLGVLWLVT